MKGALLLPVLVAAGTGYVTASPSAITSVPTCPGGNTPQPVSQGAPLKHFVRPGATAMRVCGYDGPNYQRLIRNRVTIRHITHAFNTLKEPQPGIYDCPLDDGKEVLVLFAYRNAHAERVVVKLSGCTWAMNGRSSRWTTEPSNVLSWM